MIPLYLLSRQSRLTDIRHFIATDTERLTDMLKYCKQSGTR